MAENRSHIVRIGTSGWNYPAPGYGPWTGIFYPLKQGQKIPGTKSKFDELTYYAERFNTVEINNTFYRPPAVATAKSWAARTPKDFEFSLKLYQKFTHEREVTRATSTCSSGASSRSPMPQTRRVALPVSGQLQADAPNLWSTSTSLLETFADYRLCGRTAPSFMVG